MLDRVKADRAAGDGLFDGGQNVLGPKHLEQPQDLDELAFAALGHARLDQAPQRGEFLGQVPADQRRRLVESADLLFEQRQVMQRVEDEVLALVGARMTRDHLGPAADHHLVDVAADQNLAVTIGGRHRIVGAAIAHQRQRADPARLLLAGIVGRRRQLMERRQIPHQPFANRLLVTAQAITKPAATPLEQLLVQRRKARRPRHRHQQVAARPADQSLNFAFVVAFAGPAKPVGKHVMRLQLAEHPRPLAHPVAQDARYRQRRIVVQDRARHLAEEAERGVVPVTERFGGLRRIGPHETRIAVRQVHRKEVDLALHPGDFRQRLAKIHLRMTRIVPQRHEYLAMPQPPRQHIVFYDGDPAGVAVLVAKPLEDPLRGMPLLLRSRFIRRQDARR